MIKEGQKITNIAIACDDVVFDNIEYFSYEEYGLEDKYNYRRKHLTKAAFDAGYSVVIYIDSKITPDNIEMPDSVREMLVAINTHDGNDAYRVFGGLKRVSRSGDYCKYDNNDLIEQHVYIAKDVIEINSKEIEDKVINIGTNYLTFLKKSKLHIINPLSNVVSNIWTRYDCKYLTMLYIYNLLIDLHIFDYAVINFDENISALIGKETMYLSSV